MGGAICLSTPFVIYFFFSLLLANSRSLFLIFVSSSCSKNNLQTLHLFGWSA